MKLISILKDLLGSNTDTHPLFVEPVWDSSFPALEVWVCVEDILFLLNGAWNDVEVMVK